MKKIISVTGALLMLALTVLPLAVNAAGSAPAALPPDGEVAADGINTNVVTAWIIAVSAVVFCAIITATFILAKKNKGNQ
ncbi:MAG: hypothetical protein IJG87_04135 [Ruminococcus sp.]|nr:hypothetical protein [Ruminococcus sp.]